MEADRLSGGIAPVVFKRASMWLWVVRLSVLATLMPEKKLWFSLGLRLGGRCSLCGCFGEDIILLLIPRSLNPKSSSIYPSHYSEHAAPY
jgi:hypothetical protein